MHINKPPTSSIQNVVIEKKVTTNVSGVITNPNNGASKQNESNEFPEPGGYLVNYGATASGTSNATLQSQQMLVLVTKDGIVPWYWLDLLKNGEKMDLATFPIKEKLHKA